MDKVNLEKQGLYRLGELKKYEVVKSDPDVRGWDVYSKDQKLIGKVDELIVSPEIMKVRYIDLYLNEDIKRDIDNSRHLLIPIGSAELNRDKRAVYIETIETITLLRIPVMRQGKTFPGITKTGSAEPFIRIKNSLKEKMNFIIPIYSMKINSINQGRADCNLAIL